MSRDNWMEDTVPSPRVRPDHDETGDYAQSEAAATPVYAWVLGSVVVLLTLVVCGLWSLYLLRGQVSIGGPTPTPVIWTPSPAPPSAASPIPELTETAEPIPTISPDIAIGRYVRVTGTEGRGLNLRSGPGENYNRMDIALEGEVFIVVEGPTPSGGSEWWKVRDPENEGRQWWAVGNFMEPIEHP